LFDPARSGESVLPAFSNKKVLRKQHFFENSQK
jgi:hypothetical protein